MPFAVIKSRTIKICLAAVVLMVLLAVSFQGGACAQVFFGNSTRLVPIYSVNTTEKHVAISFDAAWGADKTEDIIAVLKEYDVSATFFLVGFWAEKYPEKVKAIQEAGLEIGTHSDTHPDLAKQNADTVKTELENSMKKISDVTGKNPKLFRPPFGAYNNTVINVASGLGLTTIQWDVDSLDWKGLSAVDINTRVMKGVKNGSIILMHNNSDNVVQATKLVIENLKARGYKISCIGELIYQDNYVIDSNGVQRQK